MSTEYDAGRPGDIPWSGCRADVASSAGTLSPRRLSSTADGIGGPGRDLIGSCYPSAARENARGGGQVGRGEIIWE
jgi:hypothetical protein